MPRMGDTPDTIRRRRPRRNRARGGFTLVELLVAMTIFITVMSSVMFLFSAAIRISKQGFQSQDAFEIARGAMDILERDLSRSFTSRDHGDVFNFYGTPIGFTFIGMITADESSTPNLARVTYVLYHDSANVAGAVGDILHTVNQIDIPTYNLIRYIERAEDLESFPVDWSATLNPDDSNPFDLAGEIEDAVFASDCPDPECDDEVRKAKKRELWIRMLSGGDFSDLPGVSDVPSAWGPGGILAGLDPFDFVIAENIRHLSLEPGFRTDGIDNDADGDLDGNDPDEHIVSAGAENNPPELVFPEILQFDTANFDPDQGRVPFFTYREFGTRLRRDAAGNFIPKLDPITDLQQVDPITGDPIFEEEVAPIELRYWNDRRNIELVQLWLQNFLPSEGIELNLGSPLDARAPIEIAAKFTLFFESPYVGAPDFNRRFTMRIDLPTGYRRTFQTPVAPSP